jgi:hypothetical protein
MQVALQDIRQLTYVRREAREAAARVAQGTQKRGGPDTREPSPLCAFSVLCGSWSLTAEAVEFPVVGAANECVPFIRSEFEHRPVRMTAVAEADAAIGKARHLDAVAAGKAQGTLHPAETRIRRFGQFSECRAFHVIPRWCSRYLWKWASARGRMTTLSSRMTREQHNMYTVRPPCPSRRKVRQISRQMSRLLAANGDTAARPARNVITATTKPIGANGSRRPGRGRRTLWSARLQLTPAQSAQAQSARHQPTCC